ncbi:hypothetical protein HID58_011564 [Brassica napus]|uniref:Uncharacterized protein n=1 Tax=Brassica napus TaxID=3708 RepID=A0ABQ8DZ50_BRANA|nr:hypothetical protein HID58_011564 [Brassica napus]
MKLGKFIIFSSASAMSGEEEENAAELKIGDGNLSVIPVSVSPDITKGRAHSDEAIEKMLNDLSFVNRFE